eukprot:COSAG02_NODE_9134_length_2317_cov_2.321912_1_plen_198_part_00
MSQMWRIGRKLAVKAPRSAKRQLATLWPIGPSTRCPSAATCSASPGYCGQLLPAHCQQSRSLVSTASLATRGLPARTMFSQRLAGLSGALAVAAGAAGAHALPKRLRSLNLSIDEQKTYAEIFGTASRYHLLHAGVLLGAPLARFPGITAGLLVVGKVLFVGSLYSIAYAGSRQIEVAKAAPVGGGLLILGWLSFVL